MNKTCDIVWQNCLNIIKDIVEWQHFKTWFEPIKSVSIKNKVLTIQVPSQFFYEYIHLALPIKRIHPDDKKGRSTCNPVMIRKLEDHLIADDDKTDPRWDELRKLTGNN